MSTKFKLQPLYYFGRDVVKDNLHKELKLLKTKTVLLIYGGGSIKKNGLYNEIVGACKKCNVKVIEYPGIEPNPRDINIYRAALIARKNKVDLIIAAGGGSVIDAAKVVGIIATNPQYKNTWDYVLDNSKVKYPSIPLISAVTLAATGSENNDGSVITNAQTKYKMGTATPSATPQICFEDPKFQLTLSK
jgi:alcohol dehydrogenase YqhD (iron-dependent ADH family)